jgi:Flp pilus assembly CpaF family ATPase
MNGSARDVSAAPVDWSVVAELRARVAARLDTERARPRRPGPGDAGPGRNSSLGVGVSDAGLSDADERALAASLIGQEIEQWALARATAGWPATDRETERALAAAVTAALFGMGRLQPLLDRGDVENIHIHGADRVVLELTGGRLEAAPPVADSDAELVELLTGWAARAGQTGREFSPAHPLLNLRLPAGGPLGSRLAAVMEVTSRPTVAIRRHRLARVGLDDLLALGTLTPVLHGFLRAAVRAGCNIVVSGAPAAGKTTLLRALAVEIPSDEHVVTVEEEYELGLHVADPDRLVTAMEARQANAEGVGGIGLHALLTQALRHSPARVLVGEVRGGEVTALLAALSNGAAGGMCTLHARSAPAVLTRIAQLAQLSDPPLTSEAVWRFVADAVDLIVYLGRDPAGAGGARYVSQVLEVGAVGEGGMPDTTSVFAPNETDGRAVPAHSPSTGLRRRLGRAGFTTVPGGGPGLVDRVQQPAQVSR